MNRHFPHTLAVYTTIHEGSLAYLADFYRGLRGQLDERTTLCVGLDGVDPEQVASAVGELVPARWFPARPGDTPARLRERALVRIVREHDGVLLVDSDDVPYDGLLAAARVGLRSRDVWACAMDLVGRDGSPAGRRLALPEGRELPSVLPRANAVGFGNAAYRSATLAGCLPVPEETVLMDWLVASRAALTGATFGFDGTSRLAYRQHGRNTAFLLPPYDAATVLNGARLVARHYELLLSDPPGTPERLEPYRRAAGDARSFLDWLTSDPRHVRRYLAALDEDGRQDVLWWDHIANEEWTTSCNPST